MNAWRNVWTITKRELGAYFTSPLAYVGHMRAPLLLLSGDDDRHCPPAQAEELFAALAELVAEGRVRYVGLSNETPWGVAEFVRLAGTRMDEAPEYRVIVDRISHEVEYYRGYLKHAVLHGTYVINNPFWWTADDKFFNYSVVQKLGVTVPKTVLLPQKNYPPDVDLTAESLRSNHDCVVAVTNSECGVPMPNSIADAASSARSARTTWPS